MLKFTDSERENLGRELQVRGIPHFTLIDAKGKACIDAGKCRQAVISSLQGKDMEEIYKEFRKAAGDWSALKGFALGGANGTSNTPKSKEEMRSLRLLGMKKRENKKKLLEMGYKEEQVETVVEECGESLDNALAMLNAM